MVYDATREQGTTDVARFYDNGDFGFVPPDHVRRARDKLCRVKQSSSASEYLSEVRNDILTIPEMSDGEKLDWFCTGLNYEIRVEVPKSALGTFVDVTSVALRIDSALWTAGQGCLSVSGSVQVEKRVPMEIGNFETLGTKTSQRQNDLDKNACLICHRIGCRLWKHKDGKDKRVGLNNMGMHTPTKCGSDADSNASDSKN